MRINTDGKHQYRSELYAETAELLGEPTKSGGLDRACEFTRKMDRNLRRAIKHEDMTEDLAAILSTNEIPVEMEIRRRVGKQY